MRKILALPILVLILIFSMSLSALAQDADDVDEDFGDLMFEIAGEISFEGDDILVGGVILAPAGSFIPATLQDGDFVVVLGFLLNDDTLQVFSLEVVNPTTISGEVEITGDGFIVVNGIVIGTVEDYPDLEAGDSVTVVFYFDGDGNVVILSVTGADDADEEEADELEPEVTPEPDADDGDDADEEEAELCGPAQGHPVGLRLADEFDVSYADIMELHCSGMGFGNITRALLLADATDGDYAEYLALLAGGMSVREMMRETGIHPSELAPGRVLGQGNRPEHAGPPENRGRPDHAGPPDNRGGGNPGGGGGRGGGRP